MVKEPSRRGKLEDVAALDTRNSYFVGGIVLSVRRKYYFNNRLSASGEGRTYNQQRMRMSCFLGFILALQYRHVEDSGLF